jgi:glycosyltransferase involved in cell wall biosynthesis
VALLIQLVNQPAALTIFTPAYNRAHLLPRLFDSIAGQVPVGSAVEWLVIDDGSTDDTQAVLAVFAEQRPDLVRYMYTSNGGKHRAINLAARTARGDWLMIVDSDDLVVEGAVSNVVTQIASIRSEPSVGLMRALRRFPGNSEAPTKFRIPSNPCHYWQWLARQRTFDSAEVIARSVLIKYPFPDHPGERFMAEGWLWCSLDKNYLTFFVDRPWVECYYQPDGLSAGIRRIRAESPLSAMDVYAEMLAVPLPWKLRARWAANWWRYRFHAGRRSKDRRSTAPASRLLAPVGWLLFLRDNASAR